MHLPRFLRVLAALATLHSIVAAKDEPNSWVDPDTGHRVIQLTREPGSASLYFNENGYTPDGKRMIYTTPGGISLLDLIQPAWITAKRGRSASFQSGGGSPR